MARDEQIKNAKIVSEDLPLKNVLRHPLSRSADDRTSQYVLPALRQNRTRMEPDSLHALFCTASAHIICYETHDLSCQQTLISIPL